MSGALGAVTRGVSPQFGVGRDELGRVYSSFTLNEHLKDQAFDSKEGGVWLLWEFTKTQALPVLGGEFVASLIFSVIITIAFSLASGVAVPFAGGLVSITLASWFACQLVIGKLGHISGAHVNPMVSAALYLMHLMHFIFTGGLYLFLRDTILLILYWTGQCAGWFAGVGIAWYVISDSAATGNLGLPGPGTIDGDGIGKFPALFLETFACSIYLGVYAFAVVDRRMKENDAAHLMGITLGAITLMSTSLTGANFNMFRWLSTWAITGRPTTQFWGVYIFASWIAVPIVVVAVEIWRRALEPTTEGQVTKMTAPAMPPENKYHTSMRILKCVNGKPSYTPDGIKKKAEEIRRSNGVRPINTRAPRRGKGW